MINSIELRNKIKERIFYMTSKLLGSVIILCIMFLLIVGNSIENPNYVTTCSRIFFTLYLIFCSDLLLND